MYIYRTRAACESCNTRVILKHPSILSIYPSIHLSIGALEFRALGERLEAARDLVAREPQPLKKPAAPERLERTNQLVTPGT